MGVEIIIPLGFFAAIGIILWKFFDTRNKERMAIIERGTNPFTGENAAAGLSALFNTRDPLTNLKWGLLALFVGISLFIGIQMSVLYHWDDDFIGTFALMGGGLALIVFYVIDSKKQS